jgi:probable F420-dependent oxidoreductase
VKIDAVLSKPKLSTVGVLSRDIENLGYDGLMVPELSRDPFLPLAITAEHTSRLEIGTSVAVALPRNPLHLAHTAHDLQAFSRGRFILGLGSQVRAHIENRFSAEWSQPVARMEEFVLALRAIWRTWNEGAPLHFEGRFYRHVRMAPEFDPGPTGYGPPRVFLGGVGQAMTEVAGRVADGLFVHSFATEPYLRQATMPALERGLAQSGRSRDDLEVCLVLFTVAGSNEEEIKIARQAVRQEIAFYGSTPTYRAVLELHGWAGLQPELRRLSKLGRWSEMAELVSDDMLAAFSVDASIDGLGAAVKERYGDLVDRVALYAPYDHQAGHWGRLIDRLLPKASATS